MTASDKLRIKISSGYDGLYLPRQLSRADKEDFQFSFDDDSSETDLWVVHDGLARPLECVKARCVVLVTLEPPLQKFYPKKYLDQFDYVISPNPVATRANVLPLFQSYPWNVGCNHQSSNKIDNSLNFDYYTKLERPKKSKKLSVVCSADTRLPGHQRRLLFVRRLKAEFGDAIDWFGRGVRPIEDKIEALRDYEMHVALENSAVSNYWTEKIADPFLWHTFPIYWGAPNIIDYFDPL